MAEKKNEFPPGIEAYRRLLAFETWEDYLDSLIEIADLRNLRSLASARTVAALGYRANGDTLNEKEFYARRATIHAIVFPVVRPYVLVSEGATIDDPFFRELAVRERANRVGILQSVIFIRHFTKGGFEISGYIDYAHRLISEDWGPYFRNNKMLWPKDSDLGYYHWRHGTVRSNISRNYKSWIQKKGYFFKIVTITRSFAPIRSKIPVKIQPSRESIQNATPRLKSMIML
ncbi:cilia- and flagella-associated protein 299-like isoform X2 [Maniola jurtina]|uniref:cilia- and flagella-associated protein 299-like isoform X2 n=1 Tax=Maniola jurtina TaxID=191418 RepID=UPI001E686E4D|nr:cilia- and flagella-associated protein 299-like isoform X2 [Maniola jurtina]